MSGHIDDAELQTRPTDVISALRTRSIAIGTIGAMAMAAGFFLERGTFFQSYLIGYLFWLNITVGALGLLMVQHLTGGAWAVVSRRVLEASVKMIPVMLVLFLPIAFNAPALFEWARPEAVHDANIQTKAAYLNLNFFYVRAAIYFVLWGALAFRLTSWSEQQDAEAPQPTGPKDRRSRVLSGPGLVIFMLTVTFMSVDWMMSLDPHWSSTIMGVLFVGSSGLSTLAFSLIVLAALSRTKPMSDLMTPDRFHDLGKLMFAFVLLWAYFSVSQLIIIWSGNLPEEIPFYVRRFNGPWGWVSVVVLIGHFAVPFCFLLSSKLKRTPSMVSKVALWILVMRAVEIAWMIAPMVRHDAHAAGPNWVDFAAVLGLGLVWLPIYFGYLAARPVVPVHDPYLKDAMSHGGH